MSKWYNLPIDSRAKRGGEKQFGKNFKGGEFMPFYVPRTLMPQVDEKDYEELFSFLRAQDIPVYKEQACPLTFRPHQKVQIDRLRAMACQPDVVNKAILVSRDDYILDGHHRWDIHLLRHDSQILAYKIGRDFEEAIAALFAYPNTWTIIGHKIED